MPDDDGTEPINVATDLNDNLEKLDSSIGFVPATEALPPSTVYDGMARYNTDSGKASFWHATAAAWTQLLTAGTTFLSNLLLGDAVRIGIGTITPSAILDVIVNNITTAPLAKYAQSGESFHRLQIDHDGIRWGDGTISPETRLYRPAANQLSIVGSVAMANDLSVTGTVATTDLNVSGDFNVGGNVTGDLQIVGGAVITGILEGDGINVPIVLRKTAASTRTNTTVMAVETDFNYDLDANSSYLVELIMVYAGPSDVKVGWNFPAGTTGTRWLSGMPSTGTNSNDTTLVIAATGITTEYPYGTHNSTAYQHIRDEMCITTGGTAGQLQMKWAQVTANATAATMRENSILRITKVA
jgi:hypothetical protein